uniref:Uncharacterized protein n=1 Tax=Lepeophtheirus salmonis TaxID=72036 RepID=A0A0K2T7K3_LEPSM
MDIFFEYQYPYLLILYPNPL